MPVQQATDVTVALAAQVTPDTVGNTLDTATQILNALPHADGTWVALALAVLVVARLVWSKLKAKK